jgi:hypothetical protein
MPGLLILKLKLHRLAPAQPPGLFLFTGKKIKGKGGSRDERLHAN